MKYGTFGQQFQTKIPLKLRKQLVCMAKSARTRKIEPLQGYLVDLPSGFFMVILGPENPKVFDDNNKPLDMDCVFQLKKGAKK